MINTNGQSVVYWNPLKISGTIEGVTWGKQAQATLEGELPRVPSINPRSTVSRYGSRRIYSGNEHHREANR